jgi:hypothetical protein
MTVTSHTQNNFLQIYIFMFIVLLSWLYFFATFQAGFWNHGQPMCFMWHTYIFVILYGSVQ